MINSHSNPLFKKNNLVSRPSNNAASNMVELINTRFSQEDSGVSVSISKEARALMQKIGEYAGVKTSQGSESMPHFIFLIALCPSHRCFDNNLEIDNYTRLDKASRIDGYHNASRICFNSLAEKYEKIREELKSTYMGSKLEDKLNQLTEDYKFLLRNIACRLSRIITPATRPGESEIVISSEWRDKLSDKGLSLRDLGLGLSLEEMLEKLAGLEEHKSLFNSTDDIINFIENLIMQMGQEAKQSIIENSTS